MENLNLNLNLKDFDIMGIFSLSEVSGIEKYVTKVSDNEFLSRSTEYYKVKSGKELSHMREELKLLLTNTMVLE